MEHIPVLGNNSFRACCWAVGGCYYPMVQRPHCPGQGLVTLPELPNRASCQGVAAGGCSACRFRTIIPGHHLAESRASELGWRPGGLKL